MTREPGGEGHPLSRVLGRVAGDRHGATLLCVAGIHGNEPAGIEALGRVFKTLAERRQVVHGELVGLAGNLAALTRQRRYVDTDLNRDWRAGSVDSQTGTQAVEDVERRELVGALEQVFGRANGDVYVIDLHTTSGAGVPFLVMGDTLANRAFAKNFPVPFILGLEEHLDGTLGEYLTYLGHTALALEAGQHDSPTSVDNAEAAVWIALAAAGLIDERDTPEVSRSREILAAATARVPRIMDVRYRHPVLNGDAFKMKLGFENFDPVTSGQLLARDQNGDIHSRWQGRVLMPLYQEQGNDGFFIVREFRPEWLKLSAALRYLRLDAIVHWLPGVSRHPTRPETLVVERKLLRRYSMDVLHLLGFRRVRSVGGVLMVSRRMRAGGN